MTKTPEGIRPFHGDFENQNLLSMHQLSEFDVGTLLAEACAAEVVTQDSNRRGIDLLAGVELKAVMRQPSTRTGGSMATAMTKLGGRTQVISGMESSSEGKGETREDSWVAFATQADIIGTRTAEVGGPIEAVEAIEGALFWGKLDLQVPVINLGDGTNEHPTQALGDLYTIYKKFRQFDGLSMAIVGDHERYRAHHSLMIGASIMGMNVVAVESEAAKVPEEYADLLGGRLKRTGDLDEAMQEVDILYMGRNPDEYDGKNDSERDRSVQLAVDYQGWMVDYDRLQQMKPEAMVLHPRPRRNELHPSIDCDPRTYDVQQMANMIPMRMAIIAQLLGKSIREVVQ